METPGALAVELDEEYGDRERWRYFRRLWWVGRGSSYQHEKSIDWVLNLTQSHIPECRWR
jgi:hypothetical protein